jgi:hypothetical protein
MDYRRLAKKIIKEALELSEVGDGMAVKSLDFHKAEVPRYIKHDYPKDVYYRFSIEGQRYKVRFVIYGKGNIASLSFNNEESNGEYAILNKGHLFKVMSGVVKATRKFMDEYPEVVEIDFNGVDKSGRVTDEELTGRTRLYVAYANQNLPSEWSIERSNSEPNEVILKRKNVVSTKN